MGGRPAKPIELLVSEGRKHLTKEEIDRRKNNEIRFGGKKLRCPDFVRNDPEALRKWKEVTSLYKDFDFVGSGDSGMLARYCKVHSEYVDMLDAYQRIKKIVYDDCFEDALSELDLELKTQKQLKELIGLNAIFSTESAINKKVDLLIKMEDRLFLNPAAKLKNIPKKPDVEPVDSNAGMFG